MLHSHDAPGPGSNQDQFFGAGGVDGEGVVQVAPGDALAHRDRETLQHISLQGLYPCGEGAGYAGGILSSAIDGENAAEAAARALGATQQAKPL